MKTKLFSVLLLVFFVVSSSFAQQGAKTNAPAGIPNFYQNQYGTTVGNSRSAMDALVFIEYVAGSDFVVPALVNLGYTVTIASNWPDFDTKLATGNYGLAVGANQANFSLPSATVVQSYINGGGCMIFNDWTKNAALGAIFEASYTSADNQNQMTISDAILAQGVSNPISFINPGWFYIYTMGLTATGGGQVLATFPNGNAAVVRGNGGKTIILGYLTDVPSITDRQKLFENVVKSVLCGAPPVPVSNWALYIGIFLIVTFAVIRFRKMV